MSAPPPANRTASATKRTGHAMGAATFSDPTAYRQYPAPRATAPDDVTAEHPHNVLTRRIFEAFNGGDARALVEGIAEDAAWRVVGAAPVSRVYRGRDEIFE